jgi:lipopolysaccharide export system protein LptC
VDRKHLTLTAAVILFAALLWWLSGLIHLPRTAPSPASADVPDYTMENMHATQMDKAGQPEYRLTAQTLTHYPVRKLSLLDKPNLVQYHPGDVTVTTRADRASFPDSGREIEMFDNVRIVERRKGRVVSDVSANHTKVLLKPRPKPASEKK